MNVEKLAVGQVAGKTIEEIEKSLSKKSFDDLRSLLAIYECSLEELPHKIARAKGVKCLQTKKKN